MIYETKRYLEKWVEIFNTGDADEIIKLYHDDAINQQVANDPVSEKVEFVELVDHGNHLTFST